MCEVYAFILQWQNKNLKIILFNVFIRKLGLTLELGQLMGI